MSDGPDNSAIFDPFPTEEDLRLILPVDVADRTEPLSPIQMPEEAVAALREHLAGHALDDERAAQAINSTVHLALTRHAASRRPNWTALRESISQQLTDAHRTLAEVRRRADSVATLSHHEAVLLARAARAEHTRAPPGYGFVDGANEQRARHDPLEYQAHQLEWEERLARRVAVLKLAHQSLGRRPGGFFHPLVAALARHWLHATGAKPSYSRRQVARDLADDVAFLTETVGPFADYCRLAIACLPAECRDDLDGFETAIRAACDGTSGEVGLRDELSRM